MRWYEYKMEVDDLHASEGLKAKLLAMQAKADASGATPKPQLTPVPAPEPAKKKKAIRFPGRRVLEAAACAALCGGILYGAARVGSLPSVTLLSGRHPAPPLPTRPPRSWPPTPWRTQVVPTAP